MIFRGGRGVQARDLWSASDVTYDRLGDQQVNMRGREHHVTCLLLQLSQDTRDLGDKIASPLKAIKKNR